MKRLILTLAGAVLFTGPLRAGDSAQVMMRGIEFPPGEAEKILRTVKMEDRYDAMAKAVDEGKAVDLYNGMMRCRIGQKSTAGSALEVIYPTEYESPVMCGQEKLEKEKPHMLDDILGIENATAFETREMGDTFEAEVRKAREPGYYWLAILFENQKQEPDRVLMRLEFQKGSPQQMTMPQFRSNRHQQDLLLADGAWMMLAIFDSSRKDAPKGTKVVMWVNVETISSSSSNK